ncbi:MAG TPA: nuclease PIN [Muricauda sp.]|uniref:Pirin family protein n=1 Tax=Flagellimonas aurea TaxID=2915619 RepID=A0ABS3G5N2_9FLAO|nr:MULTISPECIES: pirin family protein [Allomuricauda]MAU14224.1 nuclease PIN [Allomuricauda sp.]MBC73418.1 nuclease PIN [Allomuricauda sp.]MBO0353877.1 pirin family protein [Allomuricauda aurea]HBU78136.1 nuclease PIN [Allomuricauda sp.]|tara:strand:- start:22964 stop:23695 length:732 start_codon:yes stop_codon:yes gene_type:complete
MIHKHGIDKKIKSQKISSLFPGCGISSEDTGLGTIGKIDHARIPSGITIKMHPHINDDILSYFRTGVSKHMDSENISAEISRKRLMLMQAGSIFYHEERILEPLEGLQIFIRPQHKDDSPKVTFYDLEETDSMDHWRLLASPTPQTPLRFTSETWIYDLRVKEQTQLGLPALPKKGLTAVLYVFQGEVLLNETIGLIKEESVVMQDEPVQLEAEPDTELVLFFTDSDSDCYKNGMFSGNQFKL